jgi:hypothetical protein
MDSSAYPGDSVMTSLIQDTNMKWTGFYLGPTPSHSGTEWMTKRSFLVGLGWGLAPLYVGEQDSGRGSLHPSGPKGTIDATDAIHLAKGAGFPLGTVLYLDIETGSMSPNLTAYANAWIAGVNGGGYTAGVYCSHLLGNHFAGLLKPPVIWAFNVNDQRGSYSDPFPEPNPSGSGVASARSWQYAQGVSISWNAGAKNYGNVDMDSSTVADPGKP